MPLTARSSVPFSWQTSKNVSQIEIINKDRDPILTDRPAFLEKEFIAESEPLGTDPLMAGASIEASQMFQDSLLVKESKLYDTSREFVLPKSESIE